MPEKVGEQGLQETKIVKDVAMESTKSVQPLVSHTKPSSSSTAGGPSSPGGGGISSQISFRSRTDSVIEYTPPMVGEAAGSTFYITKAGHIDYVVLLKVNLFSMFLFNTVHLSLLNIKIRISV